MTNSIHTTYSTHLITKYLLIVPPTQNISIFKSSHGTKLEVEDHCAYVAASVPGPEMYDPRESYADSPHLSPSPSPTCTHAQCTTVGQGEDSDDKHFPLERGRLRYTLDLRGFEISSRQMCGESPTSECRISLSSS